MRKATETKEDKPMRFSKFDDVKVAWKNFVRLVESASLLVVAVFAIYGAYHYELPKAVFDALIFSGAIIGLRGALEFFRYLAQK